MACLQVTRRLSRDRDVRLATRPGLSPNAFSFPERPLARAMPRAGNKPARKYPSGGSCNHFYSLAYSGVSELVCLAKTSSTQTAFLQSAPSLSWEPPVGSPPASTMTQERFQAHCLPTNHGTPNVKLFNGLVAFPPSSHVKRYLKSPGCSSSRSCETRLTRASG